MPKHEKAKLAPDYLEVFQQKDALEMYRFLSRHPEIRYSIPELLDILDLDKKSVIGALGELVKVELIESLYDKKRKEKLFCLAEKEHVKLLEASRIEYKISKCKE